MREAGPLTVAIARVATADGLDGLGSAQARRGCL